MKIAAIIQARMGSSRLPGKVLMDLAGKPLIARVAERARKVPGVDEVVVAVPEGAADAPLRAVVSGLEGVTLFAGHPTDVLDRYCEAARRVGAAVVLRITADCPFVDPAIAGKVIAELITAGCDFASNNQPPTYPHGLDVEVFRFSALEAAVREATLEFDREHVGPYVRSRPERFKAVHVRNPEDLHAMRWTVDEPADLEFARAVAARLGDRIETATFEEIVAILRAEPGLMAINAGVKSARA